MADTFTLKIDEYNELKEFRQKFRDLENDMKAVGLLVLAAARCGYVDSNQQDALIFALERITKEPRAVIRLSLATPPKGYQYGRY